MPKFINLKFERGVSRDSFHRINNLGQELWQLILYIIEEEWPLLCQNMVV